VVVDEAHLQFDVIRKWMESKQKLIFVDLSARPWSRGLGMYYDSLVKPTSLSDLIARGYLSPHRTFVPSHPDLGGVSTVAGDYHEGQPG
jgi:DNA repair protein RadD